MDRMNPSATAGTSTSTLPGAFVNSAEGNDFMNIGHNMTKFENVTNLTINTHCATQDATSGPIATPNVFVTLATLLLGGIFGLKASETHNGNTPQQLTPDDGARGPSEPRASVTEIQDITASAPLSVLNTVNSTISPSTQSSPSERYIRSLLEFNQGYPLYEPELESHEEGVRVGDVGLITEDGGFDFLFNVCQPSDTNPDELPDKFEMLGSPEIQVKAHFQSDTHLFNKEVKRTEEPDIKYTCSGFEGGVLELPLGATRFEAKNKLSFKDLATRHAENWYRYTVSTRGRDAPNGSLYIVTSCIKCTDWGIAVFDRPSDDQDYLRFMTNEENQNERSKYRWKGSGAHITKVVPNGGSAGSDGPNQCVFLRGYKIMLPGDIWDNITNSESTGTSSVRESPDSPHSGNKSESPRQGDSSNRDGPSQSRANSSSGSDCGTTRATQNTCSRTNTSARVILSEYSKPSLAHPSDLINAMLLCQEPKAKVALTHDDDWCDLLQYHSQILDSDAFAKVSLPYTSNVDEYGCASLKRPNDIVVESCSDTCVTSTSENRLPIDNRRTNPIHKLPDDLALAQQDHPHPSNATTRLSIPHSHISYHLMSSATATVGSDVDRTFAREDLGPDAGVMNFPPFGSFMQSGADPSVATTLPDLPTVYKTKFPTQELPSKGDDPIFVQEKDRWQQFNTATRSPTPRLRTSYDPNRVFSRVDSVVMNFPPFGSFRQSGADPSVATTLPDFPTAYKTKFPTQELPSKGDGPIFVQEKDHWQLFNTATRSSTPHLRTSYDPISFTTATAGSGVNRVFAHEDSRVNSGAMGLPHFGSFMRGGAAHLQPQHCQIHAPSIWQQVQHKQLSSKSDGLDFLQEYQPLNATTGYLTDHSQTSPHLLSTTEGDVNRTFSHEDVEVDIGVKSFPPFGYSGAEPSAVTTPQDPPTYNYVAGALDENTNKYSPVSEGDTVNWRCNLSGCQYVSRSKTDMERHCSSLSHGRRREYRCGYCGKEFVRKDTLIRHERERCRWLRQG